MASMAAIRSCGVRSNHWRGRASAWWSLRFVKTGFMTDQAWRTTVVNARRLNSGDQGTRFDAEANHGRGATPCSCRGLGEMTAGCGDARL